MSFGAECAAFGPNTPARLYKTAQRTASACPTTPPSCTNAQYLHSIAADKRPASEPSAAEKAYDGQRISTTFRSIATFLDAESEWIWGQGATGKEREDAKRFVAGDMDAGAAEREKLVRGIGNAGMEGRWAEWYGVGSGVLHLR